ncbi:MAG: MarR family transcriptional regulator [Deltaproteobacteria bacterium]|nr:MarR family transcriptional regulator [Deltaproteobacteria bacterium]
MHAGDDASHALDALRRIVRSLRTSAHRAENSVGLSGAQLFVLHELGDTPAASLAELASRTLTDPSSVSVVVARLVARRLVARTPSSTDRRRRELSLTAAGRALCARAPMPVQFGLIAAVRSLSPTTRKALRTSMEALAAAMGIDAEPPTMFFEESPRPASSRRRRG